jgi:hypothetical protein
MSDVRLSHSLVAIHQTRISLERQSRKPNADSDINAIERTTKENDRAA